MLKREDSTSTYTRFFDKVICILHEDGESIIALAEQSDPREFYRDRPGWATIKLRKAYEHLDGARHPRIVSILLEKLCPGPLQDLELPQHVNRTMLSLYYRWALQTLSALLFLHSHNIYTCNFSSHGTWLRSDFSVAVTGFICAVIDGVKDEENYGESGGWIGDEEPYCGNMEGSVDDCRGSVKEDLYYWAVWVFWLMVRDRPHSDLFEELEDERLGPVLNKVWEDGYDRTEEVVRDIKMYAERAGINVVGDDEVDIGRPWGEEFDIMAKEEVIFELKPKNLPDRFRRLNQIMPREWPTVEESAMLFNKGQIKGKR
ncbi:uncharacterized protein N0V89_007845 [Didymosphaeria variabile]|uniref:Protein kinase domain-containing protein n=1 Tax=Didymosphaeria variabile TaxID=1932322 RepID=A0A9W9CAU9_9PLEO|nr:uncharacterized protein N0V89_007845 [Didymosphaeria variabile]KAJ4352497.1 hypothetical protein N0V89_007845 [Didymosphaeria variabile]